MNATKTDNDPDRLAAQIYRQVITHHRNQIKFLCSMIRDGSGHRETCFKIAKSHAQEIKDTLRDWEHSQWRKQAFNNPFSASA